ncbi:MAG: ABC-F family ATP-binding cassette domain-containing protein [Magnetococcales bacterium]|nr:ABC-F family ATP-binding cassette domain-containing protein [Magnetococcales bacterium]
MLYIENIDKYFGQTCLFKEANLLIHPNEKVGLIGPNGSGKTTLFRLIEGIEEIDGGALNLAGNVRVGILRQELQESHRTLLLETFEGDQELVLLLAEREQTNLALENTEQTNLTLSNRLGEIDHRLEEIDAFTAESRAGTILLGLGFDKTDLDRPLSHFSGGWRMRVALARLLFSRADLLLLDEPTNHLDLESVAWLEKHLTQMEGTIIVISHDRGFLNRTTQITVSVENQTLVRYAGSYDLYEIQREERRRLLTKSAEKQAAEIEQIQQFINRFRAQATKAKQVQSRVKQLEKINRIQAPPPLPPAPVIRLPAPPPCAQEVLTLQGVSKQFGENVLFERLNLRLEKGNKVGLLGPNGVGKSSLLKIITGALTADAGAVVQGDRVNIAHFAQHTLESLSPQHTIMESAQESAPPGFKETPLRTILGGFLFSGEAVFKSVSVLSGGEKARLSLARLFLSGANLLLLDEPTNHLDMGARAALQKALKAYAGTLVIITHDRDLMESVCNQFWLIGEQKVTLWESDLSLYLEQITGTQESQKKPLQSEPNSNAAPTKRNNKELRQETARIRQTFQKATQKATKRLQSLESEIEQTEFSLKTLEGQLADPQIHTDANKDKLKELIANTGKSTADLENKMTEWEQLSEQIQREKERADLALAQLQ